MHMSDTLLSPVVGVAMWAATAGVAAYSAKKLKDDFEESKVPLMGVLGAFVFAAQMINFSIPGTGSSGHLGGGMLLAILLGPYAGFLSIASVLVVQALFFADGGLFALGCNIFNLGFFPCFIAYPLIFRSISSRMSAGKHFQEGSGYGRRMVPASILASVVGLQLGALGVVLETVLSRVTEMSFTHFILLMQPIHLAIGVVEGIVTAGVVVYILKAKPELIVKSFSRDSKVTVPFYSSFEPLAHLSSSAGRHRLKNVLIVLGALTVITGGIFSWFASTHPDGLEWSIFRVTGTEEVENTGSRIHSLSTRFQGKTAVLPDYAFKEHAPGGKIGLVEKTERSMQSAEATATDTASLADASGDTAWPSVDSGTTLSGLVGALLTLVLAGIAGFIVVKRFGAGRERKSIR